MISSDLSHYHDYDTARRLDAATAAAIERGDWAQLGADNACGYLPVAGLLIEAARRGLAAQRLALCNSGDTAGGRDRVVGYNAWIWEETPRDRFFRAGAKPAASAGVCARASRPPSRSARSAKGRQTDCGSIDDYAVGSDGKGSLSCRGRRA